MNEGTRVGKVGNQLSWETSTVLGPGVPPGRLQGCHGHDAAHLARHRSGEKALQSGPQRSLQRASPHLHRQLHPNPGRWEFCPTLGRRERGQRGTSWEAGSKSSGVGDRKTGGQRQKLGSERGSVHQRTPEEWRSSWRRERAGRGAEAQGCFGNSRGWLEPQEARAPGKSSGAYLTLPPAEGKRGTTASHHQVRQAAQAHAQTQGCGAETHCRTASRRKGGAGKWGSPT